MIRFEHHKSSELTGKPEVSIKWNLRLFAQSMINNIRRKK